MKNRLFVCVIILLAIPMFAFAGQTMIVPVMYHTIQEAVAACTTTNSLIIVQPNSANGGNPYNLIGADGIVIPAALNGLTIRSAKPADPCCVATTVIDCQGSGRAFTIEDGVGQIKIEGFTIRNGYACGLTGADAVQANYNPNDPNTVTGGSVVGEGYGGAIKIGAGNAPIIRNCVFNNCNVYGAKGGKGIDAFKYHIPPDPNDPNSDPNGTDVTVPSGKGGNGEGSGCGGAIYCGQASTPTIIDCSFSNNIAHGGIGGQGGNAISSPDPNHVTRGGIGGDGVGGGHGGAIYADQQSDPNILRCTFNSNTVIAGTAGVGGTNSDSSTSSSGGVTENDMSRGGAVYYKTGISNNLNLSTFSYNEANNHGGAVYCESSSTLNINSGCVFNYNHSAIKGGALEADNSIVNTKDVRFLNNYANLDGGAIFAGKSSEFHIFDSFFSANKAGVDDGANSVLGGGGAVATADTAIVEIQLCAFGLNTATDTGGAIDANCLLQIKSTSFSSNDALYGGGIYCDHAVSLNPDALLEGCTIRSNTADNAGGGIYLKNGIAGAGLRIVNCDIVDNSVSGADGWGGGVAGLLTGSTFENCRILRNMSSSAGGGLCFLVPYDTTIKNCLFVGNSAVDIGAAISTEYNADENLHLNFSNCTFADNTITLLTGTGGTIYNNFGCNPFINNCIFNQCNKIAVYDEDSQSTLYNNLFYGNLDGDYTVRSSYGGGTTVYTGAFRINNLSNADNNIDSNPMFVTGDLGDYYLSQIVAGQFQNSPAVDKGSDYASTLGLDTYTTRTDSLTAAGGGGDEGIVDIGYHSPKTADVGMYHLTIEIVNPYGTVTTVPVKGNNDFYAGTVVTLVAHPNFSYRVSYWQGTESDSSKELTNTVVMYSDKTIHIEFETPKILKVKSDGGSDYYSDIRDAVFAAQDGDIIEVYKGVYRGPVIELYKNVHIRSRNPNDPAYVADTIIDTQGSLYESRAFLIDGMVDSNTVIDGLTMRNCAVVEFSGGTPTVAGMNGGDGFSGLGGCIYIHTGGSPIFRNCIIRDNSLRAGNGGNGYNADTTHNAGRGGWGGWSRGGAVYCGTGSAPQFINCTFENNTAIGGNGGNGGNFAPAGGQANYGGNWSTFRYWEFPNIDPGRIGTSPADVVPNMELWQVWHQMASSTSFRSAYFLEDGNPITGYYGDYKWYGAYGGAVYCGLNSNVNFIDCKIIGNEVVGGMSGLGGDRGGKRREPQVSYELPSFGAGVYCDKGSNILFEGCTISNNVASKMQGRYRLSPIVSHGGGICSEDTASVIFRNCHINDNQADIGGGIDFSNSNPLIEDCNFVDNMAMQGGGIYGDHGVANIIGCKIFGNESMTLTDPNVTYIIDGSGGGIHISSLDVNIVDCLISENLAEYSGGGLFFDGGSYSSIINCLITDNGAGHDGGGIAVTTQADQVISNCTIVGNR
ncbi:MAG TPA: right-handed parallel beta-helix repeat-containing protein, partial [Sedimentisphaerales bacterium]|nr:right-handed parallel beta-helix repeat-containing protein [Sedimentisphaerales bacterium]